MSSLNFVNGGVQIGGTLASTSFQIVDNDGNATLDLSQLQTDVATLQTDLTAEITARTSGDSTLTASVGALETTTSSHASRLAVLEATDLATTANLASVEGRVSQAETDITSIEGRVGTAETAISTAEGEIDVLEGRVQTAEGAIAIAENDIETLQTNLASVEQSVVNTIQPALDLKAPLESPTFTGKITLSGLIEADANLGSTVFTDPLEPTRKVEIALGSASYTDGTDEILVSPTGIEKNGVDVLTKDYIGLGSVDNTSDADKPVSDATQAELDLKAPLASPAFTSQLTISDGTNTMTITPTQLAVSGSLSSSMGIEAPTNYFEVDGTEVSLKSDYTTLEVPALTINGVAVSAGGGGSAPSYPKLTRSTTANMTRTDGGASALLWNGTTRMKANTPIYNDFTMSSANQFFHIPTTGVYSINVWGRRDPSSSTEQAYFYLRSEGTTFYRSPKNDPYMVGGVINDFPVGFSGVFFLTEGERIDVIAHCTGNVNPFYLEVAQIG